MTPAEQIEPPASGPRWGGAFDTPSHRYRVYDLCVNIFIAILLVSNLVGSKMCQVGPFRISGAQAFFPITYIFGDIFTEVYGYAGSRRAIWMGFFASILMTVLTSLALWLPPAPDWPHQGAFQAVFGVVPRIVFASMAAFWLGEFTNSYVLAKMKVWTGGRWLWTRTIGSTVAGQFVDTIVVMTLAFAGTTSWANIGNMILSGYLGKVLYETAMTPLTYAVVRRLKAVEKVDVYDRGTDFNPFARGMAGEEFVPLPATSREA
jgi:queuosine precursor transporter